MLILAFVMSLSANVSSAGQAESAKTPSKAQEPNSEPTAGTTSVQTDQPGAPQVDSSVSLQADSHIETGKPVNFSAQLFPEPPPGKPARYCFSWGDGAPKDCKDAPAATHTYRARGRYSASVEVFVGQEKLVSTIQIDAALPLWMKGLVVLALILVLGIAALGMHKIRNMIRSAVSVEAGPSRHKITPAVIETGEGLHIRCVRTAAVSKITFTSSGSLPQDNKETANV
jgi:hypothetical protein